MDRFARRIAVADQLSRRGLGTLTAGALAALGLHLEADGKKKKKKKKKKTKKPPTCKPQCDGTTCGNDGCDGICQCEGDKICNLATGQCLQ
jgi:hypothetical protein